MTRLERDFLHMHRGLVGTIHGCLRFLLTVIALGLLGALRLVRWMRSCLRDPVVPSEAYVTPRAPQHETHDLTREREIA